MAEDVDDEQARQHQAWKDAGGEKLTDRLLGQNAPDDHQHRRRNKHAETARAGDGAERKALVIAVALHFRGGDARKGRRRGNADTGDERKQRVADHRGDGQAAGNPVQQAVDAAVDVGHGSRLADEFAHQHEQRDDRKDIGADGLIGRRRQHALDGMEGVGVGAGDQEDAERAGHAERDGDVNADGDQDDKTDDQQNGGIDFEHRTNPEIDRTRSRDCPHLLRNPSVRA